MIIVVRPDATEEQVDHIIKKIKDHGLQAHVSKGTERTIIGAIGDEAILQSLPLEAIPGVEKVLPDPEALQAGELGVPERENRHQRAGTGDRRQAHRGHGRALRRREQDAARGDRQGSEEGGRQLPPRRRLQTPDLALCLSGTWRRRGSSILPRRATASGLPIVTEVMDPRDIELIAKYADVLQIGARNMQNFRLLKEVGMCKKPVLLKRGISATIKEWLMSAEYIMSGGNHDVILCERGIRTYETATRNTLDLSAVPVLKQLTHLPVVVDPSHAVGKWDLVAPMAKAAVAAGADGLIIEVHSNPEEALCDGEQSLKPKSFKQLMEEMRPIAKAVGREI